MNLPFLAFYSALIVTVFLGMKHLLRRRELAEQAEQPAGDPYAIAYLRGGWLELIGVAAVSLVDRGLLAVTEGGLRSTGLAAGSSRIEQELLAFCERGRSFHEFFTARHFDGAVKEVEQELRQMRLMPDATLLAGRWKLFFAGAAVLLFVAATQIGLTISRGGSDVEPLAWLAIWGVVMLALFPINHRTARGDAFVNEMSRFSGALDVAMTAAVRGVTALPQERYGWTRQLSPPM
jgi:uncharacterized protein (TIGR04222 family)